MVQALNPKRKKVPNKKAEPQTGLGFQDLVQRPASKACVSDLSACQARPDVALRTGLAPWVI